MRRLTLVTALLACAGSAAAQAQPGGAAASATRSVSFLACPIFRDSERQCWLAEHQGKLYYIGRYGLGTPPQLLHKVLIEGTVREGVSSCGVTVIEPVKISNLQEIDARCNTVLPGNGDGPSEPDFLALAPAILSTIGKELPPAQGPFVDRVDTIEFDFDSSFLNGGSQRLVEIAAKYAIGGKARFVHVTGHVASSRLDDGTLMSEKAGMAKERAAVVASALIGLGVKAPVITRSDDPRAAPGNGIDDPSRRRVTIDIRFDH